MAARIRVALLVLAATVGTSSTAAAQLNSGEATATLTAVLPESLSVILLPGAVTFTLTSGSATNAGSLSIAATTVWTLAVTRTDLTLYGYFSSASAALVHTIPTNTMDIPSERVEVSVNGAAAVPFNQTVPFGAASAGRQLVTQAISLLTATGQRTDTLALNINLSNYGLPADAYIGTLRIRAQTTP